MAEPFEYRSETILEWRHGLRHAYLGEVPSPVVYEMQGALRQYYREEDAPVLPSTLDHIVAGVGG